VFRFFAQVRWTPDWTKPWSAQGQVAASSDTSAGQHIYFLEGDLNEPESGGPYGRWGYTAMFTFTPMHLKVEYDAVEETIRVTVTNIKENRTQVMDKSYVSPFLLQTWLLSKGTTG
jgi:hypothetical protein